MRNGKQPEIETVLKEVVALVDEVGANQAELSTVKDELRRTVETVRSLNGSLHGPDARSAFAQLYGHEDRLVRLERERDDRLASERERERTGERPGARPSWVGPVALCLGAVASLLAIVCVVVQLAR